MCVRVRVHEDGWMDDEIKQVEELNMPSMCRTLYDLYFVCSPTQSTVKTSTDIYCYLFLCSAILFLLCILRTTTDDECVSSSDFCCSCVAYCI